MHTTSQQHQVDKRLSAANAVSNGQNDTRVGRLMVDNRPIAVKQAKMIAIQQKSTRSTQVNDQRSANKGLIQRKVEQHQHGADGLVEPEYLTGTWKDTAYSVAEGAVKVAGGVAGLASIPAAIPAVAAYTGISATTAGAVSAGAWGANAVGDLAMNYGPGIVKKGAGLVSGIYNYFRGPDQGEQQPLLGHGQNNHAINGAPQQQGGPLLPQGPMPNNDVLIPIDDQQDNHQGGQRPGTGLLSDEDSN